MAYTKTANGFQIIASNLSGNNCGNLTTGQDLTGWNMRHCETGALTNALGLLVQVLLAVIAFTCLIAKRYCEPALHRRSWMIWFFDTSKQVIGAGVIHSANVLISERVYLGDPCTWYVLNFLLDSTIGLAVIYVGLRLAYCFGQWMQWASMRNGEYGEPPAVKVWAKQCFVYVLVILVEKVIISLFTLLNFWLQVTEHVMAKMSSADAELILVMFVIPLVVNTIIFWVVDNFLMRPKYGGKQPSEGRGRLGCCCRLSTMATSSATQYRKLRKRLQRRRDSCSQEDDSEADALFPIAEKCAGHEAAQNV